jgi:hypothetical protein
MQTTKLVSEVNEYKNKINRFSQENENMKKSVK